MSYLEKTYPKCIEINEVNENIEAYEFAIKVLAEQAGKLAAEYEVEFWRNTKSPDAVIIN